MRHLKPYKIFNESDDYDNFSIEEIRKRKDPNESIINTVMDICQDISDEWFDVECFTIGKYGPNPSPDEDITLYIGMVDENMGTEKLFYIGKVIPCIKRVVEYMESEGRVTDGVELIVDGGFNTRSPKIIKIDDLLKFRKTSGMSIKFTKKVLEREIPNEWFEKNPKNYLVTNKHIKQKSKLSHTDKTVREWLSDIDYKDITITKDTKNDPQIKYRCIYINKDYFMFDKKLMDFLIQTNEFNRIHTAFGGQLDPTLRDMGLGYKCYKAVINKVGWARSSEYCSNENSRRIWKNLIKDPDYYAFEVETTEDGREYPGFIVFKKTMKESQIRNILKVFTKEGNKIITYDETLPKYGIFKESILSKASAGELRSTCEDILLDLKDEGYDTKIFVNDYKRVVDPSDEVKWVNIDIQKEGSWTTDVSDVMNRLNDYFESEGLILYSQGPKHKVPGTRNTYSYDMSYVVDVPN